ncbi:hypothetical protein V1283_003863 [Bradyrhizobium sp. AZCC 2262]|uniref:hypothetical protein n=1 Tax=Bradyrhizobium sp. AZCC 2262 TaxID=3117022 RepID=UPI002FF2F902
MLRKWTLLTLILSLDSSGTLQANPLDSPGVVYIDGLPCNRACQSYMAWSYRALSARHHQERETSVAVPDEAEIQRVEPVARPLVTRHAVPASRTAPHAGKAASNVRLPNTKVSNSKKIAAPNSAPQGPAKDIPAATAAVTPEKAAEETVAGIQKPERKVEGSDRPEPTQGAAIVASQPAEAPKSGIKSEVTLPPPATLEIAAAPAASESAALPATAGAAPASAPRTIQQQVVEATAMADLVTAIGTGREAADKPDNPATGPGEAGDTAKPASASPDNRDNLVALVLARPEINSLSDLNNRNIAIEEKQSAASGSVSAALMAAGAAEVQFSEAKAGAIERLISGEVPAAVLTLASREAADWFPDIKGFRTFRIPLALKARL